MTASASASVPESDENSSSSSGEAASVCLLHPSRSGSQGAEFGGERRRRGDAKRRANKNKKKKRRRRAATATSTAARSGDSDGGGDQGGSRRETSAAVAPLLSPTLAKDEEAPADETTKESMTAGTVASGGGRGAVGLGLAGKPMAHEAGQMHGKDREDHDDRDYGQNAADKGPGIGVERAHRWGVNEASALAFLTGIPLEPRDELRERDHGYHHYHHQDGDSDVSSSNSTDGVDSGSGDSVERRERRRSTRRRRQQIRLEKRRMMRERKLREAANRLRAKNLFSPEGTLKAFLAQCRYPVEESVAPGVHVSFGDSLHNAASGGSGSYGGGDRSLGGRTDRNGPDPTLAGGGELSPNAFNAMGDIGELSFASKEIVDAARGGFFFLTNAEYERQVQRSRRAAVREQRRQSRHPESGTQVHDAAASSGGASMGAAAEMGVDGNQSTRSYEGGEAEIHKNGAPLFRVGGVTENLHVHEINAGAPVGSADVTDSLIAASIGLASGIVAGGMATSSLVPVIRPMAASTLSAASTTTVSSTLRRETVQLVALAGGIVGPADVTLHTTGLVGNQSTAGLNGAEGSLVSDMPQPEGGDEVNVGAEVFNAFSSANANEPDAIAAQGTADQSRRGNRVLFAAPSRAGSILSVFSIIAGPDTSTVLAQDTQVARPSVSTLEDSPSRDTSEELHVMALISATSRLGTASRTAQELRKGRAFARVLIPTWSVTMSHMLSVIQQQLLLQWTQQFQHYYVLLQEQQQQKQLDGDRDTSDDDGSDNLHQGAEKNAGLRKGRSARRLGKSPSSLGSGLFQSLAAVPLAPPTPPPLYYVLQHSQMIATGVSLPRVVNVLCWETPTLAEHVFQSSTRRTVLELPSFRGSVLPYVRPEELKHDLNQQFAERHPHVRVRLSTLRKTKLLLAEAFSEGGFEVASLALTFLLLDTLVLKKRPGAPIGRFAARLVDFGGGDSEHLDDPTSTPSGSLGAAVSSSLPKDYTPAPLDAEKLRLRSLSSAFHDAMLHLVRVSGPTVAQLVASTAAIGFFSPDTADARLSMEEEIGDMDPEVDSAGSAPVSKENIGLYAACCTLLALKFADRVFEPSADSDSVGEQDVAKTVMDLLERRLPDVNRDEVFEAEFLVFAELEFGVFLSSRQVLEEYVRAHDVFAFDSSS